MVDFAGRSAGLTRAAFVALALFSLAWSPAVADEDNFNQGAYDSASSTGISNANCNSALILFCDSADGAPAIGPGVVGMGGALGLLALGGMAAIRRRAA